MIDVSDGVGSEIQHIMKQSKVGAMVWRAQIPVHRDVQRVEEGLHLPPCHCALSGGEDYELLFTLPPKNLPRLKEMFSDFTVIGKVVRDVNTKWLLNPDGTRSPIPGGWDHVQQL
jgi:thiamine-monophosphate kinase